MVRNTSILLCKIVSPANAAPYLQEFLICNDQRQSKY